jgi:hypothetical protein
MTITNDDWADLLRRMNRLERVARYTATLLIYLAAIGCGAGVFFGSRNVLGDDLAGWVAILSWVITGGLLHWELRRNQDTRAKDGKHPL